MAVVDRKGDVQIGFNLLQLSRKLDRKGFNSYVMVGNNSILKLTCWGCYGAIAQLHMFSTAPNLDLSKTNIMIAYVFM